MQIAAVKTGLRNLVLLAQEYRDRVPNETNEEIKELKGQLKFGASDENSFTNERLHGLKKERRKTRNDIFKQLIFFIEKVLFEFATKNASPGSIKIKESRVDKVRKSLSKAEIDLLSDAYSLYNSLRNRKWYRKGEYEPKEVRGFKDEVLKVIDSAHKLGREIRNREMVAVN